MDSEVALQEEDMDGSWTLLSWLASLLMVFGGALPYVPQFQEIQRSSNTEGFSTRVCLVLLIANILRIFFWIGKQFELTLLLQSVVMILTMFAMLHLCCTVQNTNRVSTKQHRLTDLNLQYFWKWSAVEDYLLFCFGFTVLCAVVTMLLLDSAVFVEMLGFLAVMFEAMLGVPQLLQNFHNHSTKGMRGKADLKQADGVEAQHSSTLHEEEGMTRKDEDQTWLMEDFIWILTRKPERLQSEGSATCII
ncbi:solute carrier family 66 member 2 isoform X1 [Melanotaenia boesemani]|uniref:solute carrier family 66 member 2 isoform X1 n=1 Tax=Melanotaenia boesemani TaxID=1250792 RepID=UPI001C04EC0B|nr:solute carrier family 66 member 2 isoform X1 [Melanotaenia boesemani]